MSLSFLLFAYTSSLYTLYFFYGVLGGTGLGFGFGTVVPVVAKWFPDRTSVWRSVWRSRDSAADRRFLDRSQIWCYFPGLDGALPA